MVPFPTTTTLWIDYIFLDHPHFPCYRPIWLFILIRYGLFRPFPGRDYHSMMLPPYHIPLPTTSHSAASHAMSRTCCCAIWLFIIHFTRSIILPCMHGTVLFSSLPIHFSILPVLILLPSSVVLPYAFAYHTYASSNLTCPIPFLFNCVFPFSSVSATCLPFFWLVGQQPCTCTHHLPTAPYLLRRTAFMGSDTCLRPMPLLPHLVAVTAVPPLVREPFTCCAFGRWFYFPVLFTLIFCRHN